MNIRRDGGLLRISGLVVVQQGRGLNDGVGEVPLIQAQFTEAAHHAVGQHAPQFAPGDLLAAGESGVVLGHGYQVAGVNVPRAGDDLHGFALRHVHLADPHVVAVGVALHRENAAHDDIGDLGSQILGDLHLGAGKGHGLGKVPVVYRAHVYEFL